MHKRIVRMLYVAACVVLLAFVVIGAAAQGAPEPINAALADLNNRLGLALTLNDLADWSWSQNAYDNVSLGCPQPGIQYAPQTVIGYRFELTYNSIVYDYRVAADQTIVILCTSTSLVEITPEPTVVDPSSSNPLCPPPPAGIVYPSTRLAVNIQGSVLPNEPNIVRSEPATTGATLGLIPVGSVFNVVAGPRCDATGLVWWQVDFDGLIGWTAEGSGGVFWVEPAPSAPLPPEIDVITPANAALLAETSRLYGNFAPGLTWSFSTEVDLPARLLALGGTGSGGLWVYDSSALDTSPRIIALGTNLTNAVTSVNPLLALVGAGDGSIRLWDLATNAPLLERARLQSQDGAVSAVAFSRDGAVLAASGGRAILLQDQPDNQYAIALWDVATVSMRAQGLRGHTDQVVDLYYSADNTRLYSASRDGTVRLWNTSTGEGVAYYNAGQPINAMTFLNDGSAFALATDARVIVVDALSGEVRAELPVPAAVTSLSFSQDGALLVTGDAVGTVVVWDVAAAVSGSEQAAVMTLTGHQGAVVAVSVSPAGNAIVSQGADNTIRWWVVVADLG